MKDETDKIMLLLLALLLASIGSMFFMWSPVHHLGMGFIWLIFIIAVVIIMTGDKKKKR